MRKIPIHLFYERKSTNLCTPHGSPSPHRGTPKDLLSFKREIGEKLRVASTPEGRGHLSGRFACTTDRNGP